MEENCDLKPHVVEIKCEPVLSDDEYSTYSTEPSQEVSCAVSKTTIVERVSTTITETVDISHVNDSLPAVESTVSGDNDVLSTIKEEDIAPTIKMEIKTEIPEDEDPLGGADSTDNWQVSPEAGPSSFFEEKTAVFLNEHPVKQENESTEIVQFQNPSVGNFYTEGGMQVLQIQGGVPNIDQDPHKQQPSLTNNPPKVRPYTCLYCLMQFTRRDSLNRHTKKSCRMKVQSECSLPGGIQSVKVEGIAAPDIGQHVAPQSEIETAGSLNGVGQIGEKQESCEAGLPSFLNENCAILRNQLRLKEENDSIKNVELLNCGFETAYSGNGLEFLKTEVSVSDIGQDLYEQSEVGEIESTIGESGPFLSGELAIKYEFSEGISSANGGLTFAENLPQRRISQRCLEKGKRKRVPKRPSERVIHFCKYCSRIFKIRKDLEKHLKKNSKTNCRRKPIICEYCSTSFSTKTRLIQHVLRSHPEGRRFECAHCLERFKGKQALMRHIKFHSAERPFACNQCSKRFSSKSALKNHLHGHSGEKPFVCDLCPERFASKSGLTIHLLVHSEEKPNFTCDQCSKGFFSEAVFKAHLPTHSRRRLFSCDKCSAEFTEKSSLKEHSRTHNVYRDLSEEELLARSIRREAKQSQITLHTCKFCPAEFNTQKRLKKHLDIHPEHKSFICDQCPARFKLVSRLNKHVRAHSNKRFCCDHCQNRFVNKSSLRTHLNLHCRFAKFRMQSAS